MKVLGILSLCLGLIACNGLKPKSEREAYEEEEVVIGEENAAVSSAIVALNLLQIVDGDGLMQTEIGIDLPNSQTVNNWSIYYGPSPSMTTMTSITKDNLPETKSIIWMTSLIPLGTYHLAVLLDTTRGDIIWYDPQPFVLAESQTAETIDIAINSPTAKQVYSISDTIDVQWQVPTPTAKVDYSSDNGATWIPIAEAGTSPLSWEPPLTAYGSEFVIRVSSADADGNLYEGRSEKFAVVDQAITISDVKSVLTNNCRTCHNDQTQNGGFNSNADDSIAQFQEAIVTTTRPGASNPMPPTGDLGTRDRSTLQIWQWSGFPIN